jgi:hypothetical protein
MRTSSCEQRKSPYSMSYEEEDTCVSYGRRIHVSHMTHRYPPAHMTAEDDHHTKVRERGGARNGWTGKRRREGGEGGKGGRQEAEMRDARFFFVMSRYTK